MGRNAISRPYSPLLHTLYFEIYNIRDKHWTTLQGIDSTIQINAPLLRSLHFISPDDRSGDNFLNASR